MGLLRRQPDNPMFATTAAPASAGGPGARPKRKAPRWQRAAVMGVGPAVWGAVGVIAFLIGGKEHNGAVFLILSGLLILAMSVWMVWVVRRKFRDQREHAARSVVTTGEVVVVDIKGVKGDASYEEFPVIRFTTAD